MNFEQAFEKLLDPQHEGGFSDDPADPGNWTGGAIGKGVLKGTKYGISAASYPHEDIKNLTIPRAREIYRRDYWGPAACDAVSDRLRFDLFDMAVNSGVGAAVETLQRAVGAEPDRVIGRLTLQAISAAPVDRTFARFNGHRLLYLASLKNWPNAGRGWARRIAANLLA